MGQDLLLLGQRFFYFAALLLLVLLHHMLVLLFLETLHSRSEANAHGQQLLLILHVADCILPLLLYQSLLLR
jgi:hypothetical protein